MKLTHNQREALRALYHAEARYESLSDEQYSRITAHCREVLGEDLCEQLANLSVSEKFSPSDFDYYSTASDAVIDQLVKDALES